MTEIIEKPLVISPAIHRFILHWGDLGGQWGVNRSVAQIHALLLACDRPIHAEEIADALGIARSNVSTSLKELLTWQLVKREPIPGDRRDHFVAEGDMWEMISRIVDMRKARELDPATRILNDCLSDAQEDPTTPRAAVERLGELQELIGLLNGWYDQMNKFPKSTLLSLIKMGSRIVDLVSPLAGKGGGRNQTKH